MKKSVLLFPILLFASIQVFADGAKPKSQIYQTALAQDKVLFDAYNECNLETLGKISDENLEFYHDKGGLMNGKTAFLEAVKNNICNKVERQLVKSSFEAYELENYGFVEAGSHTFCNKVETPICKDKTNGIGRFFMIWRKDPNGYKLVRVISYEHLNSNQRKFPSNKK